MRVLFSFIGFVLLFASCEKPNQVNQDQNQLFGSWRLAEVIAYDRKNSEVDKLTKSMLSNQLIAKGYVLHFFADSTFTEIDGYSAKFGKLLFRTVDQIETKDFSFRLKGFEKIKSRDYLILDIDQKHEDLKSTFKFVKEGTPLEDFKMDPFYPDNNHWRNPPKHKESEAEIRKRLLNYILHYAYILNASEERDHQTVSFTHSLGLIQVFRGGIGRIPKNKIKEEWINCFYDQEDAMIAFDIFSSYLKKGAYKGGSSGNWVKDDFEILIHIYQLMKTDVDTQN